MVKVYKVKIKPKNAIILKGKVYFADIEYELEMTNVELVAFRDSLDLISHTLISEEETTVKETEKTETRRGRPPKRG